MFKNYIIYIGTLSISASLDREMFIALADFCSFETSKNEGIIRLSTIEGCYSLSYIPLSDKYNKIVKAIELLVSITHKKYLVPFF